MSGSAATLPRGASAAPAPAQAATAPAAAIPRLRSALLACVVLAAATLLAPSAPTYDPWAWIIWGREIVQLDLSTTFGPSWKPLPVALTTVYSLFGDAAPELWVLTARAGALAGALFAFLLGRRLAGPAGGAVAALALLAAPWYVRNAALANSEGLQVAFALAAVERALAGRRTTAFWLGLGLALLRPEAWPFLGLYGAWLVWRDRRRLVPAAAGLASLPLLWLVPEELGSGDWLRAAHRAQNPVSGSTADAQNPLLQVLRDGWSMLGTPLAWLFAGAIVYAVARRDRRLAVLVGLVGAWALLVGVMTANGYSGNARYLVVPAAVAIVAGAAAAARAVAGVMGGRARVPVLAGLAAAAVVPWLGDSREVLRATAWQAGLTEQLADVVARAGGAERVLACGPAVTGAYLVPAVAWELGVHIRDVRLAPAPRSTVLRVHTTRGAPAVPTLAPLAGVGVRTLARTEDWRVVQTCGAGG